MKNIILTSVFAFSISIGGLFGGNSDACLVHGEEYCCHSNNKKVEICKVPPGNPDNAHTICVGEPSLTAHLDTGSYLGECTVSELDPCDLESNLDGCVSDGIYF